MSSVEHPLSLNSELHHAFSEKVAWHTALVVNGVRTQLTSATGQIVSSEGVGVGSACCWNGKKLILTAKHVLEGALSADIRFFLRPNGAIDWGTRSSPPLAAQTTVLEVEDLITCPFEDLACMILGTKESCQGRLEFADLPKDFGDVPDSGGATLIVGSPTDRTLSIAEGQAGSIHWRALAMQPRGCWAVVAGEAPKYFPSSFDPRQHFLLHYDPAQEGSLPYGFSGSGVWYRRRKTESLWAADPVLAGVQVSWHRESNLMIAVRSDVVRQFLQQSIN
jgi:hypothetical protein